MTQPAGGPVTRLTSPVTQRSSRRRSKPLCDVTRRAARDSRADDVTRRIQVLGAMRPDRYGEAGDAKRNAPATLSGVDGRFGAALR